MKWKMGIYANREEPDEMLHNAAFRQGLHSLLRQNRYSENTPDMRRSKTLILSTNVYQKSLETEFSIAFGLVQ